jgi:integrase
MRRDRGRLNGGAITYAPDTFHDDGSYIVAPRDADYDRLGWLPVVDKPPKYIPDGYHYERRDPVDEDGVITWQYVLVKDPPPPPRTFRKSWLAQWMYANGKWPTFQNFLGTPDAMGIAFLWSVCTEFDEDNAEWPTALAAIKAALALTDAEADAMLAFGATGGQP